jgi:hypothetical protein
MMLNRLPQQDQCVRHYYRKVALFDRSIGCWLSISEWILRRASVTDATMI